MNAATPESRLPREKVIYILSMSVVAAIALVYGILVAHPPVAFVLASCLPGTVLAALMLWSKRCSNRFLVYLLILPVAFEGRHLVERIFFGRSWAGDWPMFAVQCGAFWLGFALVFPVFKNAGKAAPEETCRAA